MDRTASPVTLLVTLLALSALTIGAAPTGGADAVPGSSRTSVQLVELTIGAPGTDSTTAGLGQLRVTSLRDGGSWAGMELVGAAVADQEAAGWNMTTDERSERTASASAPLPSVAGVKAALDLVDARVRAGATDAEAALQSIRGELGIDPLSLSLANSGPALVNQVDDDSTSTSSLQLGALDLTLGDLLPPGLIDNLPLGVVLDILNSLPVSLTTVEDLVTQVEELINALREIADVNEALDDARAELNELVGDAPGVEDAEAAVAAAEDAVAKAKADLAAAIADRDAAKSALDTATAALDDVLAQVGAEQADLQADLDAAEAAEASAQAAVDSAQAAVTSAQSALTSAQSTHSKALADQTSAQNQVNAIQTNLTSVTNQISALETEKAGLDPVLDAARILEIDNELTTLNAQKTQLEADLAAANTTLTSATNAVTAAAADVTAKQSTLNSAQATLTAAQADLADAQQAIADAQAAIASAGGSTAASAQAAVDAAQADHDAAKAAVSAARTAVATAEAALTEATNTLDEVVDEAAALLGDTTKALRDEITTLRTTLEDLLESVTQLAVDLPDLSSLLEQLRDALARVPVISMGGVSLDIELAADSQKGSVGVNCSIESVTVLGQTLDSPSCGEASELIATVAPAIEQLLSALPIAELPVPRIAGLQVTMDASESPDENGITWALAKVTGLAVQIPSVSLGSLADSLTAELDGLLTDALGAANLLPNLDALTAASSDYSVSSVVSTLSDLRAQLDGLPVGAQLAGMQTMGVDLTVGHMAAEVLNGVAAAGYLDPGSPFQADLGAPEPIGTPTDSEGDPTGVPVDDPSLPVTGAGTVVLPLALMLGGLLLARRSRSSV